MRRLLDGLVIALGIGCALLLARFTMQLLAARPDNPVVISVLALTAPLITPLAFLDRGQPHVGAILEYSTLAAVAVLLLIIGLMRFVRR